MQDKPDTIVAIATPSGEGGIGVLRLSGEASLTGLSAICRKDPGEFEPRRATLTGLSTPGSREILDRGLVTYFPSPRSYTGEDVVEISCHGSPLLLRKLLEGLVEQPDLRMAKPGEFTRRAYENEKLDLAQADAVAALIGARSEAALRASARQLEGELSEVVRDLREQLLYCRSRIEAGLDFSDQESVGAIPFETIDQRLGAIQDRIDELIAEGEHGRLVQQGCYTAIVGRPNVGKSSLLNRLVDADRAIVTREPGTTRDVVSESVVIRGIPFRLHDTAGIRPDPDRIESEGIQRSKSVLERSDLVVFLTDRSHSLTEADQTIGEMLGDRPHLLVSNKIDLEKRVETDQYRRHLGQTPDCEVSARTGEGLEELKQKMVRQLQNGRVAVENPLVTQTRHLDALRDTREGIERARDSIKREVEAPLVAEDLREATRSAGRITGEITTEDMLDQIFSDFCIGK